MTYSWRDDIDALTNAARAAGISPENPFALNLENKSIEAARALEARVNEPELGIIAKPLFEDTMAPNRGRFSRVEFAWVEAELAEPVAFDIAYSFAANFDLISSEPDVASHFFVEPDSSDSDGEDVESAAVKLFCEVSGTPPPNTHWAPEMIKVREALQYAASVQGAGVGGARVLVAQPDTGVVLPNADLEDGAIEAGLGWSILDNRAGAVDPHNYPGNPAHGTATGSVVVSREAGVILGSAPAAVLYPIRCIKAVTIFNAGPVAQAIEKAIQVDANVITMSLGGVPSRAVQAAIRAATARGMIVLAAAGNCVRIVVWPARYADCIAVAGCNISAKPWKGSCRGKSVDITAPAEQVWVASAQDPRGYKDGQGTSFAVALTAGAAAQWLSFHGVDKLKQLAKDREVTVQDLFRKAAQQTATPAPKLSTKDFGPGIINVEALLKLPLDQIGVVGKVSADRIAEGEQAPPGEFVELLKAFGPDAEAARIDWLRYGAEVGNVALKRAMSARALGVEIENSAEAATSNTLTEVANSKNNTALRNLLGAQ